MTTDLAYSARGFELTADGDLATIEGDVAVKACLGRAIATDPGSIPYAPDTGAGAESVVGGPPVDAGALGRRVVTEARRDPDVIAASSAYVNVTPSATQITVRVRTRATPTTETPMSYEFGR